MDATEKFLADVAARLPLPDEQRAEVVEELAAHLSDAAADLAAQGRDRTGAEAEVLRRLGSAEDLARDLLRARRSRAQLLAAAGAGTWAAIRTGLLGTLAGWVLVVFAAVLASVGVSALSRVFGLTASLGWTAGWNSFLTAAGLAVGAFLAGAAAVRAVASRGWRMPGEVRLAVALVGFIVLGYVVLCRLEQALNWASVIGFLLVPVAFGVGARFERVRPPSARLVLVILLAALVLLVPGVFLTASGSGGSGDPTSYQWSDDTHGYTMIAPWWQTPGASDDFPTGDAGWSMPGVETIDVQAANEGVIAKFRDFRLEAWRADAPGNGWRLIPGQRGPFATAAAAIDGTTISGTIRFNQVPAVDWAQVVLTAVGPDGQRYLLTASGPAQTEFYGSVWAWLSAVIR